MAPPATLTRFTLLATFLMVPYLAAAQNWELVWSEEFDGGEVDTTKWSFQLGDGCPELCGWGNGEEQYYTADNASVVDGILRITAREDTIGGRPYTSARMRTLGKASWKYGRIETRAKMPKTSGYWPAIWMLPEDNAYGNWAASGEIDILEVFGTAPGTVHGTIHFGGVAPANTFEGGSYSLPFGDFARSFREFAIEWVPGEIRWYVDGKLYHTATTWYSTEARFPAPFDQEFHLLMNVAIGGAGGPVGVNSVFPQSLEVDYIRVFQSDNATPEITLDAPGNGASIAPGSDLTISATPTDSDGSISRVEFFVGDALIGSAVAAPYELTVTGVAEGCYVVRAVAIDNLGGVTTSDTAMISAGACGQAPYLMQPTSVPGIIPAEQYDLGGEGVAYADLTPSNDLSSEYRADEGVDIVYILGRDQGFAVGAFEGGEWLEYTVDVSFDGVYNVDLRTRSAAGAVLNVLVDGASVASDLTVAADTNGVLSTTRLQQVQLAAGLHVLRIEATGGSLDLDQIEVNPYVEPPAEGVFVVDNFDGPNAGADWQYYSAMAGTVTRGAENNQFMRVTSSGRGVGFYGVMWKDLPNDAQVSIPSDPWLSARIRHSSTETTVNAYTLEITIREDANGDGWTSGQEDSFRLDTRFETAAFDDEWILVSAPFSSFSNLGTGGNGILERAIDEVVFVVSAVTGPNPSTVQFDFDDVTISSGAIGSGLERDLHGAVNLDKPYPNPSSGVVRFGVELRSPGDATVEVFDLLGRRVHRLDRQNQPAGLQQVSIDLRYLAAGLYFVRLSAGEASDIRKLIIAR
jgi:beta-glucanase (GH16 family)